MKELTDPQLAAEYVNAAILEDPDLLPVVLREVAKAHTMKRVAEQAGLARESLYTSLSEAGNPTLTNLNGILKAVGLKIEIVPDSVKPSVPERSPGIGVAEYTPNENVRSGISTLTIFTHSDADHLSTAILLGAEPSLGTVNLGFELQSGTDAFSRKNLGLRDCLGIRMPQQATQDQSGILGSPKMASASSQAYLRQLATSASAGAQPIIQ
jgi:probable addiction module antidote protein